MKIPSLSYERPGIISAPIYERNTSNNLFGYRYCSWTEKYKCLQSSSPDAISVIFLFRWIAQVAIVNAYYSVEMNAISKLCVT